MALLSRLKTQQKYDPYFLRIRFQIKVLIPYCTDMHNTVPVLFVFVLFAVIFFALLHRGTYPVYFRNIPITRSLIIYVGFVIWVTDICYLPSSTRQVGAANKSFNHLHCTSLKIVNNCRPWSAVLCTSRPTLSKHYTPGTVLGNIDNINPTIVW